jgi:hypothetical protein
VDRDCILLVALISNSAFLIQGEQKVFVYLCENVAVLLWMWASPITKNVGGM